MNAVTVSADLKLIIPPKFCQSLGLCPGQQLQIICYNDRIELIPIRPITTLRGFLVGIETTIEREDDRL